ncbi:MAG TPA: FAD-dependent thymidylate synthase [Alphaproteobacteria bacterium]|nr:FAD-dependent thymidylate synthase [Alphaproteobacteria bacterium]
MQPYAVMLPPPDSIFERFTRGEGIALLKRVERFARKSHRSEDAITNTSYDKLLRSIVLKHGDWSVTEYAGVSVELLFDRGISHEFVRHRLQALTQESTRFVNYEKKIPPSFIYPFDDDAHDEAIDPDWMDAIEPCESAYKKLIQKGWRPQRARSVLPHALSTGLISTMNLRMWRHLFLMRTTRETHPQMRRVAIPLLREFQATIPILYEDIVPMARQADNLRMGK